MFFGDFKLNLYFLQRVMEYKTLILVDGENLVTMA